MVKTRDCDQEKLMITFTKLSENKSIFSIYFKYDTTIYFKLFTLNFEFTLKGIAG